MYLYGGSELNLLYSSDASEHLWVWEYETEEGSHDMYMDLDEDIRFRVVQEQFTDIIPTNGQLLYTKL